MHLTELTALRPRTTAASIVHLSQFVLTRKSVMPEKLDGFPGASHDTLEAAHDLDQLFERLIASRPYETAERAEYRWKIGFHGAEGELAALYLANLSGLGLLGEQPLAFGNTELLGWLYDRFAPSEAEKLAKFAGSAPR